MSAEIAELRRLLDLLVPYGWEHSEERPGLRRTYEACERILQRNDGSGGQSKTLGNSEQSDGTREEN